MQTVKLKIKENQHLHGRFYKLIFESDEMAPLSKPGQFVHIKITETKHPLLRRPFSIYQVIDNQIEILYEVIGEGTKLLSEKLAGDNLDVLGPLGNHFLEDEKPGDPILVGGGIGIAPLLFLGNDLLKRNIKPKAILGFRSNSDIVCVDDFLSAGIEVFIATNDGSVGTKGFVTDLLKDKINSESKVYTCGPMPMLSAVSEICIDKSVECEVSIHNFMGCGFGACLGCVFPSENGYKRVCKDGPVFQAKELKF